MRHRPHHRLLEEARQRRDGEIDLRLAQAGEVPGAGDPHPELAGDERIAAVGVRGRRDLQRVAEPAPELGDLDRRRLGERRVLQVGGVDVGAVLPEQVVEAPGVAAGVAGPDGEAERVAPGHLLRHRHQLVAAAGHPRLAVGAGQSRLLHDLHVQIEDVLRHVERQRVALALEHAALPRRRQVVVAAEALAGERGVVDRFQNAVAGEVRHLHGVDQRQVRALAGRHRDLQLRVELGPRDPLLLDLDAGVAREAIDQLVHHLAVGAGQPVPVGERGLGLRDGAARPRGRRRRGGHASEEPATAHGAMGTGHGASSGRESTAAPRTCQPGCPTLDCAA